MTIFIKDNYSPRDLLAKQDEIMALARALLDPMHFAELLLDRSYGHLGRAMSTLLSASNDLRQQQIAAEELDVKDLEAVTDVDARFAFNALVHHFGDECIYQITKTNLLKKQYGGNAA